MFLDLNDFKDYRMNSYATIHNDMIIVHAHTRDLATHTHFDNTSSGLLGGLRGVKWLLVESFKSL